ncbi:toll/interleukin-1 receptor domain-containing protein [Paraburkholderia terricola]|uniref:toll/interleukin-1 receptor domain-containing protein n=1 Tax=Paraburkholderia terricola TaxID=169427 RepID=UPI001FD19F74|nr:toll/interleukin-1 receptor domain-containing protein [Paraburkholderia terricola]
MIKCFLSHSSKDKDAYVRVVAQKLPKEVKVFDEATFEAGMITADEIARGLDESTLFVIFLSDSALNSQWVQDELTDAKARFDSTQIERIYPIIVEAGLRHDDPRIPKWMRETLNIQIIVKPTVAARKIRARLLELSWKFHPRLKERREIFVGRNVLVQEIEERLDDFSKESPIALVASGLPAIGRKALLQHAARKANLVRDSYEFPIVTLSTFDNIEDFLLRIVDLGVVSATVDDLASIPMREKLNRLKGVLVDFAKDGERLLIEDHGVLVQRSGELVDWFREALVHLAPIAHLTFCIASQYRLNPSLNRTNQLVYSVAVKELDRAERNGLLTRYSRFHSLNLNREDLSFFSDILTGYPEQVLFAVDLVKDYGAYEARSQSHTIQQYASDKAQVVLEQYKYKQKELEFIYFLCRFEFVSYEVLFEIVDQDEYFGILADLLGSSICERLGESSDYVRVNEVIRDFVSRNRFKISDKFEQAIRGHVKRFIDESDKDDKDISDYIFSAQEALRSKDVISENLIVPSVFLKAIRKMYDEDRNYADAITLADRALERKAFLHATTINYIQFILCQSLARLRLHRFFDEVRLVHEPDRSFLYGFYYRITGNYVKAEESLLHALNGDRRKRDPRVLGELVLVYMQSEEYEKALELAKENYHNRPSNPINANNYFTCLIMKDRSAQTRQELEGIVGRLEIDPSEKGSEMANSMRARLVAYFDNDEQESLRMVEDAIHRYADVSYPLLTKADLAAYFENKEKLREAIQALEREIGRNAQSYRSLQKFKALLAAMEGNLGAAEEILRKDLSGLIPGALQRLRERVTHLSGRS